jgi:hypothetical protein
MREPLTDDEAKQLRKTAQMCFSHYTGCRGRDPDNCSGCALINGGEGGPNYAGWARVYVEAGRTIPLNWKAAFQRELDSDNRAYAEFLQRCIEYFGVRFTDTHME